MTEKPTKLVRLLRTHGARVGDVGAIAGGSIRSVAENFKERFSRLTGLLRARGRRRDEAEDAVQEAYLRLLTYVKRGEAVAQPEAFLTRTAYNVAIDVRRGSRAHLYDGRPIEKLELVDLAPGPEETVASEDLLKRTQRQLDEVVGERARTVFFLSYYDELSMEQIAKQVNRSVRTVERDLAMALKALCMVDRG